MTTSDDPKLRSAIFTVLATHAGISGQEILFDLATEPGRSLIRREAAAGLLSAFGTVAPGIVAKITEELLATQIESVATRLALMLGAAGPVEEIQRAASYLAASPKRRVLLLPLIQFTNGRGLRIAMDLAAI